MKDKRNEIPGMNIINCRDRGFPSWGKEAKQPRYQQFWGPTQEQPVFKCPGIGVEDKGCPSNDCGRSSCNGGSPGSASPAEAAGSSGLSTVQFASFEEHTSTPVPGTCLPLTLQTVDTSERITPLTADTVQLATGIYLVHFLVSGTLAEAGYLEITPVTGGTARPEYAARFNTFSPGDRGSVSGSFTVTGASSMTLSLRMDSSATPADANVPVMILRVAE